ncbi:MAG: 3-phosphoserine/phosphohydroxythreonine transaminase [Alphaproteobacteria bacterium]|nr:3-phosphoserine/phosphohydroxythreonine transaminase [Alphaproteobacteria bacterium]
MSRQHNFSAGPGVLPESVVQQTQEALWELEGCGQGLAETSHRGKAFDAVFQRCKDRVRTLLGLSEDQEVLLLHGGARTQFYQIPMNLLRGGTAAYLDTGAWSHYAIEDARRFGEVVVPWSSREQGYDSVPAAGQWGSVPAGTRYLHYTSNNTIAGTEYDHVPEVDGTWLVCDASSNILSRPIDGSRFDLLYAGAQKNLGTSGVTLVVIRKALVEAGDKDLPPMLRYDKQVAKDSMLNTPCTVGIYVVERVLAWIEAQGGVAAVDARNDRQAAAVYGTIDATGFWHGKAQRASRSRMNVTFTTGDDALDARFVKEATAAGLHGLKGHRSVGGLRASLYNAQTDAAVDALVAFMKDFEQRVG